MCVVLGDGVSVKAWEGLVLTFKRAVVCDHFLFISRMHARSSPLSRLTPQFCFSGLCIESVCRRAAREADAGQFGFQIAAPAPLLQCKIKHEAIYRV